MFNKLMNNSLVGFLFGVIMSLLGYLGLADAWFALTFGALFVVAKELINNQMLDNPANDKVVISGLIGNLVTFLGILLL